MAVSKPALNPELEELRLKALRSAEGEDGNLNREIEDLVKSTSRIHAAFLFHSPKTLQPLLRAVGETNSYALDSGWQIFGDKLGLDISILKVINNNQFNHEDPVYNTLLHYVQYEDATVGKILKALLEMGRLDAIVRTKIVLQELTMTILNHERDLMRHSHSTSDYGSFESDGSSTTSITALDEVIIKPEVIPDAPFIIKNVQATPLLSSLLLQNATSARTNVICSPTFSQALQRETLLQASPVAPVSNLVAAGPQNSVKSACTRKVLLTFAQDGVDVAAEVARVFRQQRGTSRIGVVILAEQQRLLQADPILFISAAFQQVDYVVPIITEEYLRTILRKQKVDPARSECLDADYVPFIYQTMSHDYTRRGCLNDKVRCLIPDEHLSKVLAHLAMAGPLFSAWERASRADGLAERILAANA